MSEREQFEAWYGEYYTTHIPKNRDGEYCNIDTLLAWKTWRASRRAALEEAIVACNGVDLIGADDCIDAIRALTDGDKQ